MYILQELPMVYDINGLRTFWGGLEVSLHLELMIGVMASWLNALGLV